MIESDEVLEARIAWPGVACVELAEDRLLDRHLLRHRLDHEVDVAEALVGGGAGDLAHHLGQAGVGLLLGELLLLDQAAELALGHRPRLLQRGIDELLVDVFDDDGDVGGGDRLRDLAPHGAAADDGGLETNICGRPSLEIGLALRPGGYPFRPPAAAVPANVGTVSVPGPEGPELKRSLLESELELDALACDEVIEHEWGRAFLSPSLPDVWDASFVAIERPGLSPEEVLAAAEEALAERRHRKVVVVDEDEGRRLGAAIAPRCRAGRRNGSSTWSGRAASAARRRRPRSSRSGSPPAPSCATS